jgi:hypothetical protein
MSKICLQSLERNYIVQFLNYHIAAGHFKYVEDILIINNTLNEEHYIPGFNAV